MGQWKNVRSSAGTKKIPEKQYKYLDLDRELKQLWNTKLAMMPIIRTIIITISKNLQIRQIERDINGRIKTIKTTVLLKLISAT